MRRCVTPWYYSRGTARRCVTAGSFCRGTTRRRGINREGPRRVKIVTTPSRLLCHLPAVQKFLATIWPLIEMLLSLFFQCNKRISLKLFYVHTSAQIRPTVKVVVITLVVQAANFINFTCERIELQIYSTHTHMLNLPTLPTEPNYEYSNNKLLQ